MAKDMLDLEKAMGARAPDDAQVLPAMAGGGEQELLTPDPHIEGAPVAASRFAAAMVVNNTRTKKRQLYLYWLLLAASVIIVTNHVLPGGGNTAAAAIPGFAKYIVLLCSICLIVRAMK